MPRANASASRRWRTGLRTAARHEVPWLVVLRGSQIRLYPAKPGVGVGQKGQADTWFEMDLAVVDEEQAALLPLVFSAAALAANGSTQELLDGSSQFAVELGARLRDRVYDQVIPTLSQAVAAQLPALGIPVDAAGLDVAYKLTMRILFRLLFQAYAEDRGLLPYGRNAKFDAHSLKEWAQEYIDDPHQEFHAESVSIWSRPSDHLGRHRWRRSGLGRPGLQRRPFRRRQDPAP